MSHKEMIISFPHMGNYSAVFKQILKNLFPQAKVLVPPPITQKTIELGERHSPEDICAPFKFNLGNYIEALDLGANILIQSGTGCRYGYFGELQEEILRGLGYEFNFCCFSRENATPLNILKLLREMGCDKSLPQILNAFYLAIKSIGVLDEFEFWLRQNIGFELTKGSMEAELQRLISALPSICSKPQLTKLIQQHRQRLLKIDIAPPEQLIQVGLVGDLFTLMEPNSNYFIEKQLALEGIVVSRMMSLSFLLFGKSDNSSLNSCCGYLDFIPGANGVDSVAQSLDYARRNFDGVIHIKAFGCIPELNVTDALHRISKDTGLPIMHLSFDTQTNETGIQTRIEAFSDMIKMKKEVLMHGQSGH